MAYFQICTITKVCQTFPSVTNTRFLLTPDKRHLKSNGSTQTCLVSQMDYIHVIDLIEFPLNKVTEIFTHTNDKVLDCIIKNNKITIIGDNEKILFDEQIDNCDINVERTGLIIYATKEFLFNNNFQMF